MGPRSTSVYKLFQVYVRFSQPGRVTRAARFSKDEGETGHENPLQSQCRMRDGLRETNYLKLVIFAQQRPNSFSHAYTKGASIAAFDIYSLVFIPPNVKRPLNDDSSCYMVHLKKVSPWCLSEDVG